MDMPVYPGDPLTPGVGATKDAKRLAVEEAKTLTKIPVMPISYGDAQPLLAALEGPVAPAAWRGALPITYHVGPGPAKVHLKLKFNWDLKPLYDVIARIPGSTYPDEWIIRGNHHDAWVNGAEDPVSGPSALMEEARGLGALLKQGWKPKRTIIYCGVGWRRARAARLHRVGGGARRRVAAARGGLYQFRWQRPRLPRAWTARTRLEKFINGVARDIEDPETKMTVWKRLQASRIADARAADDERSCASAAGPAHRGAGLGLGLHGVSRSSRHRVPEPGIRRRRPAAASTIRSTTISTGTRISPTPISSMGGRWRRPSGPR